MLTVIKKIIKSDKVAEDNKKNLSIEESEASEEYTPSRIKQRRAEVVYGQVNILESCSSESSQRTLEAVVEI